VRWTRRSGGSRRAGRATAGTPGVPFRDVSSAGTGTEFYEDAAAARFPYNRAYPPVRRPRHGTVHDW
jgi:hypothetical protein